MEDGVRDILDLNERRNAEMYAPFNPITGKGSIGERMRFELPDFAVPVQYIPKSMSDVPLVKQLKKANTIKAFVTDTLKRQYSAEAHAAVEDALIRLRIKHDFPFWAAFLVFIKNKDGGDDVRFRLTPPQRRIVSYFEKCRLENKPIRLLILKARQLGGSTVIQIYMAWLQLVHRRGLNSLIISLQTKASDEIFDMYDRMIKAYPLAMLHKLGETYKENEPKFVGVGTSGAIRRVPQRNCKIKLGSAEKPDSCRGGDYSLVHLSKVGLWKKTEGKSQRTSCSLPVRVFS